MLDLSSCGLNQSQLWQLTELPALLELPLTLEQGPPSTTHTTHEEEEEEEEEEETDQISGLNEDLQRYLHQYHFLTHLFQGST